MNRRIARRPIGWEAACEATDKTDTAIEDEVLDHIQSTGAMVEMGH